jgi:hypothetical protein
MKPDKAVELAKQFLADPDTRAQVKVQLALKGWSMLADLLDEMAIVCRALLAQQKAAPEPDQIDDPNLPSAAREGMPLEPIRYYPQDNGIMALAELGNRFGFVRGVDYDRLRAYALSRREREGRSHER